MKPAESDTLVLVTRVVNTPYCDKQGSYAAMQRLD